MIFLILPQICCLCMDICHFKLFPVTGQAHWLSFATNLVHITAKFPEKWYFSHGHMCASHHIFTHFQAQKRFFDFHPTYSHVIFLLKKPNVEGSPLNEWFMQYVSFFLTEHYTELFNNRSMNLSLSGSHDVVFSNRAVYGQCYSELY